MRKVAGKPEVSWLVAALVAGGLLAGALFVPLWKLQLIAPQYPQGLVMYAYGYKFADDPSTRYDDIREINGLNHYIGMKPLTEVTEMQLFIPSVVALVITAVLASFIRWQRCWLQRLIVAAFWFMPLFFVADLQYWLYNYGHTMDPRAPLNMDAFTPKVIGTTKVWNFHSETAFEVGFYLMIGAALTITLLPLALRWLYNRRAHTERTEVTSEAVAAAERRAYRSGIGTTARVIAIGAAVAGAAFLVTHVAADSSDESLMSLQTRIDQAAPGDTVTVEGGLFRERIIIDKPIRLIGRNWPVIDGGGEGDVLTITADDVAVFGFVVRNSGHSISKEPAAIKVAGADRVKVRNNRVEAAHFGVHVLDSTESAVDNNSIDLGADAPIERRGHGIYLWRVSQTSVHGNVISNAGDGVHLEFADENGIGSNTITDSRYGIHLMYSHRNTILSNTLRDNLSGAVLMFSHNLLVKDNELSSNRRGASGAGMLLKDVDNIFVEGNRFLRNKFGISAEGTPQSAGATAVFIRNLLALNDTGIGLMSNSPITFVENAMIDNTVQVKALGAGIPAHTAASADPHAGHQSSGHSDSPSAPQASVVQPPKGAVWAVDGRGNYWSDHQGYDANHDGVYDQPYRPRPPFAGQLDRNGALRLFQFTLAQQAIDLATKMFPVYRYQPVMEDSAPLVSPPTGLELPRGSSTLSFDMLVVSVLLVTTAGAAIVWIAGVKPEAAFRQALDVLGHGTVRRGTTT